MAAARPVSVDLTAAERGAVLSALRQEIRKCDRTRVAMLARYGEAVDREVLAKKDARMVVLLAAYGKVHGGRSDPRETSEGAG